MTITLSVVLGVMIIGQLLNASLTLINEKVDISVFFVTTAPEEDILKLKSSLESLADVSEVHYTSRDEAFASFRERYKNNEVMMQVLEELGENPLWASLSIRARETSQYESIATFLQEQKAGEDLENPLIDHVNFEDNKVAIDKLTNIINAVDKGVFITMIVLVAATILITFNTIRLAIYTTREEISVMRLVGAGNMFIRGPLILQGVMYGLVAGVLTLLIFYPFVLWLGPGTEVFFGLNVFTYYVSDFGKIFAVIVGSGVLIGGISSILAIARYLRV